MPLRALLLLAAATAWVLELVSAWSLRGDAGQVDLPAFLMAHMLGSGLLAWTVVRLLHERIPRIRLSATYLLCALMPLLNVAVFPFAVFLLRLAPETVESGRSMGFATVRPSIAGAGLMKAWEQAATKLHDEADPASVLRWSRDPERRCRAILRSMRLTDRESIRLLQLALRDPEDEVRLLAYGLLENKAQAFTVRMREHEARLAEARVPAEATALHRALAYDNWQFVSIGLAQGEVSRHYLRASRSHLNEAIRRSPKSPGLHFLLGRVLLDLGDQEASRAAFETARRCGLVPTKADVLIMDRAAVPDANRSGRRPEHPETWPDAHRRPALRYAS